jgi:glycosyltransferase involved in cell wall biosynthesis
MKLTYAADKKPLTAADHLLVLAPKRAFGPRARGAASLDQLLGAPVAELAAQLGKEASVGLLGGSATSRTAAGRRLTVGVLPDTVSRHATGARGESIRKLVAAAGIDKGKAAVLVLLDDSAFVLTACNAIARARPDYSLKSADRAEPALTIACALPGGKIAKVDAATKDIVQRAREAARFVDTPPTELDPAAFAAAANRLVSEPGLRDRLANAGRERAADEFDWLLMGRRSLDVYRGVLAR